MTVWRPLLSEPWGTAVQVDSKLGALWRAMEAGLKQVQEEQHRLVEAATVGRQGVA